MENYKKEETNRTNKVKQYATDLSSDFVSCLDFNLIIIIFIGCCSYRSPKTNYNEVHYSKYIISLHHIFSLSFKIFFFCGIRTKHLFSGLSMW